jgi:hypothetical protein
MQPKPRAETRGPFFPNVRVCMFNPYTPRLIAHLGNGSHLRGIRARWLC